MGWQGRQLTSLSGNGITAASYKYDASGLRSQKTTNGVTTKFEYVGDKLFYEKRGDRDIYYKYNSFGNLSGITYYNGSTEYTYYVLCNSRGDVETIYNGTGTLVAKYIYDAWGNIISITDANNQNITDPNHVGNINPIRYRGYYYDAETGLYHVGSRYYDPQIGRWINADSVTAGVGSVQGYNLYAYCNNNPVNMSDPSGHWPQWIKNAASAVANTVKKAATAVLNVVKSATSSIASVVKLSTPNRRPNTGKPGSTYEAPNGDKRTYGPDGNPQHDYDHDDHGQPDKHPHDENGGHNHDWDWGKVPPRQAPYAFDWKPVAGVALVTVCVIGIIAVAADDATGVGVADDFLFGPLGAGVGEGLIMVMG